MLKVTSLTVDLLNNRATVTFATDPLGGGQAMVEFPVDLHTNETDHQIDRRVRDEAKRRLQAAIAAL